MRTLRRAALAAALMVPLLSFSFLSARAETTAGDAAGTPVEGLALHDIPKYKPGFTHFDYVNPDAPKGGELRLHGLGTFDTLNPYTLKGVSADGAGMIFETLMAPSLDEPFSQYGWIAKNVTVAPDRASVTYALRPEAKFHNGSSITPEDVIFSFETLRDKGHPFYRSYYKEVVKAEKTGAHEVRFAFRDANNAELPLIMGQLPVLSRASWKDRDFAATTLDPLMGSGPYEVESVTPGRSITYKKAKDWWARNLPVNRGRFNFETIRYDYYRDATVALEAFLSGNYDFRLENIARNWKLAYDTPAVKQGLIKKQDIRNGLAAGMQGFVFNIRRPIFQDRRVREAINLAFDFEWTNKNVAYGAYARTRSYFENSELAARGLPSADELKILEPFRGKLPEEVFTKVFTPPATDGTGGNRENLRRASELLKEAGWTLKDGKLLNAEGKPFTFEFIAAEPIFERWVQPFVRNLDRLGMQVSYRIVDTAQYQNRLNDFDFDMTISVFSQSLSPGNEQFDYWSSAKAGIKGSRNLIGVHDPVVDALLEQLVKAQNRKSLVTLCHALDRVLLWQYYVVPNWYIGSFRVAYWDMFGQPGIAPPYGLEVTDAWWIDPARSKKIMDSQKRNR